MASRTRIAFTAGAVATFLVAAAVTFLHPAFAEPLRPLVNPTSEDVPLARAADPRLQPGDLAPDLRVLPPSDIYVVDDRDAGGTVRLKFTTVVWNAGDGPMEILGEPDASDGVRVRQIVHLSGGGTRQAGPVGTFDYDHRHGHVHLAAFARYELWSLEDGRLGSRVATNDKVGFCLMDNLRVDEIAASAEEGYDDGCRTGVQGISPGWGDRYVAQLYEQDLVIEGLPPGRYRLVNIANPDGTLAEARLDNNVAAVDVVLDGTSVSFASRN